VRDDAGHPLRSATAIASGARLDIEFADGRIGAVAEGGTTPIERAQPASPVKPAAKPRKPGGGGSQGSLFG
jgi:exodeoxyribonuclease VII large subunit